MTTEVEKLLIDKKVRYYDKGKDLLVSCFNPEHDDANPSMRINRDNGLFHCLGCGYKGNLFFRFNRYRNIFSSRVLEIKEHIKELKEASWAGYDIPQDAFFVQKMFRGIPADTLKKFDAFTTDLIGMEGRLVFPVSDIRGVVVGFQGRYINTDISPKYLMYPAGVSLPWYPGANKLEMLNNSIILTEGLLDALYLQGKGITNAVTIFGTKSVTHDTVLDLLTPYLLAGLDTVHILMDGDSAGRYAGENIEKMIREKTDLIINNIVLDDGMDPATLSEEYLFNLKKLLLNY